MQKFLTAKRLFSNLQLLPRIQADVAQILRRLDGKGCGNEAPVLSSTGQSHGIPSAPNAWLASSFHPSTPYFEIAQKGLLEAEYKYVADLIAGLKRDNVEGVLVEFGVFEGHWISKIAEICEQLDFQREVHGFDSFEGLPEPTGNDLKGWHAGQYAASIDSVRRNVQANLRPYLHLHKGWFSDSILRPEAQAINAISFVRIDCDLYNPAVECLNFLVGRLRNGSILVFDDWTWDDTKGETKAFNEWAPMSGYQFEFLAHNALGHVYLRVLSSR